MPGNSLAFVEVELPFHIDEGEFYVEKKVSAEPGREWIIPSSLVTAIGGLVRVPILNLDRSTLTVEPDMRLVTAEYLPRDHHDESIMCSLTHANDLDSTTLNIDSKLSPSQKSEVFQLVSEMALRNRQGIGHSNSAVHRIETGDAPPITSRPYRVSLFERKVMADEVADMTEKGIVSPSVSPWASPVVLVRKKNGERRFWVDYRRLNAITKRDVYPLPRIDDVLDCLGGASFFTSLDLASGYWQVPVEHAHREKTAFATPDGLFEFNRMPFGLCNGPATFQRLMDKVLRGLKWSMCLVYLDDILIFGRSFEEHQRRLKLVLDALASANLTLNLKKCVFAASSILHLGHLIDASGIRPDPEKVEAVKSVDVTNVRSLRGFLGLASYFRRFIPNFARALYTNF